jgi:aryl-alcohol dehydrogenase-like predicted oxidoreductase
VTLKDIPGTDLRVSSICLGTALFGATIDTPMSYALLDAFFERGGNFVDTARSYNDWIPGERARSEGLIGRWFADRRNRERAIVATKGGHAADDGTPRLNARDLTIDIDASLMRLHVEVIDLYYLHRDGPATPVEPIIDALNAHVRTGKIRYLGCSNWKAPRIREANAYAAASGQSGFVANQPMWNAAVIDTSTLMDPSLAVMDADMRRLHVDTGMACIPYSSQAGGLFTKLTSMLWTLQFRLGRGPTGYPPGPNLARFRVIEPMARERSMPISHVALAYLMSQPFVTVPIVGCRTVDQLRETMASADVRLTASDLAAIDSAR